MTYASLVGNLLTFSKLVNGSLAFFVFSISAISLYMFFVLYQVLRAKVQLFFEIRKENHRFSIRTADFYVSVLSRL